MCSIPTQYIQNISIEFYKPGVDQFVSKYNQKKENSVE